MTIRNNQPYPYGPDPFFVAGSATAPIGEVPDFARLETTPGGGGKTHRRLVCLQYQVLNWLRYYTTIDPVDPYCSHGHLVEFKCSPFEKQLRVSNASLATLFPGVAYYELAVLDLTYDATGSRYIQGFGVVMEQQRPLQHRVSVDGTRGGGHSDFGDGAVADRPNFSASLFWGATDGNANSGFSLYSGEQPYMEVGMREIILTFPFAPFNVEPFGEGTVNSDQFTFLVSGDVCPPLTLKYMGCAKEASVVVPAVGAYTGLVRYKKSFVFHKLAASVGKDNSLLTWNTYFRARDQRVLALEDSERDVYSQHPLAAYNAINWWL